MNEKITKKQGDRMKAKLLILLPLSAALFGCTRVPAGNVGVKVDLYGSDKGVQNLTVGPGYYYTGWNTQIYLFPTYLQNYTWTKDNKEDITFQTSEGLSVTTDVGITYQILPDNVSQVFQEYREGVNEITATYLRNYVRDAMNQVASTMTVDQLVGAGKEQFIEQVNQIVTQESAQKGIQIDKISLIGTFVLPESVTDSINAKIQANQNALTAQNQIATAQAQAQSTIIAAQAQAKANQLISQSLTPEIVQYNAVQKWNGILPQATGAAVPFIKLDDQQK